MTLLENLEVLLKKSIERKLHYTKCDNNNKDGIIKIDNYIFQDRPKIKL